MQSHLRQVLTLSQNDTRPRWGRGLGHPLEDPVGDVFDFESFGIGGPLLSDLNPLNSSVFLKAELDFSIGGQPFSILLDNSTGEPTTGGFIPAPEPSALSILALSMAVLALWRQSRGPRSRVGYV
jgi:hypothetical protein